MTKVSVDTGFFRNLSMAAMDLLEEYRTALESELESLKGRERAQVEAEVKALGLIGEEGFAAWNSAIDEHSLKHDMVFINFFRYSFVVLALFVFEDWLHRLCQAVREVRALEKPIPEPTREVIKAYRDYLKQSGVHSNDAIWQGVLDLKQVRNCIVHCSGNVSKVKPERVHRRLRQLARRGTGVGVSDDTSKHEQVPLYLENDMLVIQPKYLETTVADMKSLLSKLCDAVPLHALRFELPDHQNDPAQ